ncbi:MAG: ABC transporter ATP-binding protein [Anaerolineales bacterium]|nr:ABC transporter ATP-binding protein [Anaerolineales bacterium]MCB9431459.1 ABC transporter ATP-binding protein [Ardenticatenaceae bacterium]
MAALTRGLQAEKYDRQYTDKQLVQRILSYFYPHRIKGWIIILTVFLMSAASATLPIVVSRGVDAMTHSGTERLRLILVGIAFAIGVSVWVLNWIRRQLTTEVIADVIMAMRNDVFAAAAKQDMSFYDQYSTGRIVSRITSDTQEFGEVAILSTDIINQLAVALILIITLFTIEWRLTLLVLVMAPFVIMVALSFRNVARRVTQQGSRALGEVNKAIQEAVTGIRVAKNFRQEQAIYDEFKAVNGQAYTINVRRGFIVANIFPTLNILSGFATAILIYFGGRSAVSGVITVASWYLFVATVDRFWFPVSNLAAFWSQFQAGLSATERVFALIDVEPVVVQKTAVSTPKLHGDIQFQEVYFRYSPQEQVLNGFSLHIKPGESVALVGHTGAGKSSIIKLIARFYEFQEGEILLDSQDIRTLDLVTFRRQLGIVSQVPFLFAGTVADNIRYGRPEATDAEIAAIANRIGDGEWLETLPDGLHSEVGERGSRLSMGQRQLVALTRVLLQAPRIFILDEATASVDPFTESQIQEALNLIMANSTAIIIAHRLSTVRAADRIIVLQKGRIIEQGSHQHLMESRGHYAELYDTYFRHQSPQYDETVRSWREGH